MRIHSEQDPLRAFAGLGPRQILRFTKAEQATLRRAAAIADEARELWRKAVDYDVESEEFDTELAHIAIGCDEVVDGIEL